MKQLTHLISHLQPVLARFSMTEARNRTTIPAPLLIQNMLIQTSMSVRCSSFLIHVPN